MKSINTLVFALFLVCSSYAQEYFGDSTEINSILGKVKQFSIDCVEGNAENLANAYTSDGKLFPSGAEIIAGTEPIQNYWTPRGSSTISYHKITPIEIRILGEYAHDHGYYEGTTTNEDGTTSSWKGKYVMIWQKIDGEWKIYLDIWNPINSPKTD